MATGSSLQALDIFKEPACLIFNDHTNNLRVNGQVLEQVRRLPGGLVVVGVAGLYRTGKSFLLNMLAAKATERGKTMGMWGEDIANRHFALGSTISRQTDGIWIWARAHPHDPHKVLLLLDTEGLGDVEKGSFDHDNWIFSLTTLLSSVLVYNTRNVLDDDTFQRMHYITELADHVRAKSDPESEDADLDLVLPHLVFTVRDFFLDLEIEGKAITADEYLEGALKLKHGDSRRTQDYNLPRMCIRQYFKHRRCFVFDFPVHKRQLIRNLSEMQEDMMSPDFLEQVSNFCDYIFTKAPVKMLVNGQPVTGNMLGTLLNIYVDTISQGKIPVVENAVMMMATMENRKAVDDCVKLYVEMMDSGLTLPTKDYEMLSTHHLLCWKKSVEEFVGRAVFDKYSDFLQEFKDKISQEYERYGTKNEAKSMEACRTALQARLEPFKIKQSEGRYACPGGYQIYHADMHWVQEAYNNIDGLGVKKCDVLLEFLQWVAENGAAVLAADNQMTEAERKTESEKAARLEAERYKTEAERARAKAQRVAAERDNMENIRILQDRMEAALAEEKQHLEQIMKSRLQEQRRLQEEGFEKEAERLRQQVEKLQHLIQEQQKEGTGSWFQRARSGLASAAAAIGGSSLRGYIGGAATSIGTTLFGIKDDPRPKPKETKDLEDMDTSEKDDKPLQGRENAPAAVPSVSTIKQQQLKESSLKSGNVPKSLDVPEFKSYCIGSMQESVRAQIEDEIIQLIMKKEPVSQEVASYIASVVASGTEDDEFELSYNFTNDNTDPDGACVGLDGDNLNTMNGGLKLIRSKERKASVLLLQPRNYNQQNGLRSHFNKLYESILLNDSDVRPNEVSSSDNFKIPVDAFIECQNSPMHIIGFFGNACLNQDEIIWDGNRVGRRSSLFTAIVGYLRSLCSRFSKINELHLLYDKCHGHTNIYPHNISVCVFKAVKNPQFQEASPQTSGESQKPRKFLFFNAPVDGINDVPLLDDITQRNMQWLSFYSEIVAQNSAMSNSNLYERKEIYAWDQMQESIKCSIQANHNENYILTIIFNGHGDTIPEFNTSRGVLLFNRGSRQILLDDVISYIEQCLNACTSVTREVELVFAQCFAHVYTPLSPDSRIAVVHFTSSRKPKTLDIIRRDKKSKEVKAVHHAELNQYARKITGRPQSSVERHVKIEFIDITGGWTFGEG